MNYTEAIYLALAVAFAILALVVLAFYIKESLVDMPEPTEKSAETMEMPVETLVESTAPPINVAINIAEDEKNKKKDYSAGDRDNLQPYEASLVQSAMGISSDVMRVRNKPGVFIWQD